MINQFSSKITHVRVHENYYALNLTLPRRLNHEREGRHEDIVELQGKPVMVYVEGSMPIGVPFDEHQRLMQELEAQVKKRGEQELRAKIDYVNRLVATNESLRNERRRNRATINAQALTIRDLNRAIEGWEMEEEDDI